MDSDLLKDYQEFVDEVSSDATKNIDDFGDAVDIIEEQGVDQLEVDIEKLLNEK